MTAPPEREAGRDAALEPRAGRGWRCFAPIVLIAVIAVAALVFARDLLSFETLRENRQALIAWRDQNIVLAALVYASAYVLVVAFSLPGALWMTIGAGFLFGVVLGAALSVLAATLGATAIFLAARTSLGEVLKRHAGPWLARLRAGFEANEASYLLMLRLVPAVPFFIANLAPAFLGVRLSTFLWTTILGIAPATAIFAWVGAGLGGVIDRGDEPDLGLLLEPQILGPLLGLAALAALPILIKSLRSKAAPPLPGERDPAV